MRTAVSALLLAASLSTIASTHALAAWPTSASTSVVVCAAADDQFRPGVLGDGTGGAYIGWIDRRSGSDNDLYVTRIVDGAPAAGWPVNGLAVCAVPGTVGSFSLIPGASGDLFVLWQDERAGNNDVYLQRVLSNGVVAPGWPANGLALANSSRAEISSRGCIDGAGGVYVAWTLEYAPSTDYDVYATRVLPTGAFGPGFVAQGIPINAATLNQLSPDIAADGAGNAIIGYTSFDGSNVPTIWAQKLTPTAGRAWGNPLTGVSASPLGNRQQNCRVIADGHGGALIARDVTVALDIFPTVVAMGPDGDVLGSAEAYAPGGYSIQGMTPDGRGGAWIVTVQGLAPASYYLGHLDATFTFPNPALPGVFVGTSSTSTGIVAAVNSEGSATVAWMPTGATGVVGGQAYGMDQVALWGALVPLGGGPGFRSDAVCGSDGRDGTIVAWADARSGSSVRDILCTRVDRFGALGDAAPKITRIADVPNDQGGSVSLQWTASYRDVGPSYPIARYSVWRRVPGGLAAMRAGERATVLAPGEARPADATRVWREEPNATSVVYWEYVTAVPGRGFPGYSAVVPTPSDSMPGSNPRTAFRIEAETFYGVPYWDSAPDSAYSVDNLPPLPPAPFAGTYAAGTTTLTWGANAEPDLRGYRLYRGSSPSFVPSPANRVAEPASAGYVDVAGASYIYKLSAVDVHGNESAYATLVPNGVTGANDAAPPRELSLAAPRPNPAPGATTLRFALPRAGAVSLAVYDASGRRVRTLAAGEWPAGEQSVRWDGRDESGDRVGAGLYFVRLQAGGRVLQRRIALLP